MESRTQGSRPRPRTQKKSEAKAKNSLSENRPSRGQGQECSRPRTKDIAASVLQKKRSSKKFFRQSPIYRRSQNFCLGRPKSHAMTSSKLWRRFEKTSVTQTYHRRGSGGPSGRRLWGSRGEASSWWAIFCKFLEKKLF